MKYIYSAFLTFFCLVFLVVNGVYAAPLPGFSSDCLGAEVVGGGHTATLTIKESSKAKGIQPDAKTWIFACITSEQMGTKCTTGNATIDDSLFGKHDDLTALQGYQGTTVEVGGVDGGENPRTTNGDASAFTQEPTTWSDAYVPAVVHQWSWIQAAVPPASTDGTGAGSVGAQQQSKIDFITLSSDTSKCAKIAWDPRGYVFDAKTLNPVKDVYVTLSKGPKGGEFVDVPSGLGITNPDYSKPTNGQYSFFVEPGFYKLRLSSPNAVIAKLSEINPVYQNLFLSDKGKTNIYQEGAEVQEIAGSVAIAHIPVNITDPKLLLTTLNKLEETPPSEVGGKINIFGRVSHPKSKIIETMTMLTEDGTTKDIVKTEYTDDLGEYDKLIDQEQIDVADGRKLLLQNLNVDFKLNSFYTTGVFASDTHAKKTISLFESIIQYIQSKISVKAASNTSYNVKPIPTYIEGIAYDGNGVVIPKAIVGVYPFFSDNPMYVTIADENGRYKVGSQHLPQTEYTLRYKKPTGEVVVVDTGTFIKQNVKLFAKEGIKPFTAKSTSIVEDNVTKALVAQFVKDTDLKTMAAVGSTSKSTSAINSNLNNNSRNQAEAKNFGTGTNIGGFQGVTMIIVAIVILLLIGAGAFIMMKAKQSQMPPQY